MGRRRRLKLEELWRMLSTIMRVLLPLLLLNCLFPAQTNGQSPVRMSCGQTTCPVGQDCFSGRCFDPCLSSRYTTLNDSWRATDYDYRSHGGVRRYDYRLPTRWYRLFQGNYNAQIPQKCAQQRYSCGNEAPMTLKDPHPSPSSKYI